MMRSKPVSLFIVRHGEREDQVNDRWTLTAPLPYDPPLTQHGLNQAYRTGKQLKDYIMEKGWTQTEASKSIFVFSSPFFRCLQTSESILKGLGKVGEGVNIRSELGLSEWLSDDYFRYQVGDADFHCNLDGEPNHEFVNSLDGNFSDDSSASASSTNRTVIDTSNSFAGTLPKFPETYDQLMDRTDQLLTKIDTWSQNMAKTRPNLNPIIILVTHGAAVNGLLSSITKCPTITNVDLCSISWAKKQLTGSWQLKLVTSATHLKAN